VKTVAANKMVLFTSVPPKKSAAQISATPPRSRSLRMMTPDSETHVRVWKFRIERKFFSDGVRAHPIKELQRVIVARRQQDFVCLLARDPTRISNVQVEFREGGIWNYRALADRMNKLARAPVGI
jgi:hypothetical protein